MHKIDDNLLAAYLEGNLDEKEAEMVEQAIDEDEDLQAIVDDWVGIQGNLIAQKARQGLAASEYNVCAGNEGYCSNNPAPRKKPWRRIIAAASVVLMVGLGVFFIPNSEMYQGIREKRIFKGDSTNNFDTTYNVVDTAADKSDSTNILKQLTKKKNKNK